MLFRSLRAAAERTPPYAGLEFVTRDRLLETPGLEAVLVETRVRDLLDRHGCAEPLEEPIARRSGHDPGGSAPFGAGMAVFG